MNIDETFSADYIDAQFRQWQENPDSVSGEWQLFFKGFEMGRTDSANSSYSANTTGHTGLTDSRGPINQASQTTGITEDQGLKQARVASLEYRYRDIGHLLACLDPLNECPTSHPLLDLSMFDLTQEDLGLSFHTRIPDLGHASLASIIESLKETYCRSIGIEYMHLQDPDERRWLQDKMEPIRNQPNLDADTRILILKRLCHASMFEVMLNKKYPGQTRFSLEGAEALIPMMDTLVQRAVAGGVIDIILGMSHRGRLNVLVNILQKPYLEIFQEFANTYDPVSVVGSGDVKYHNGYLADLQTADGEVRIFMVNNPSHLESVDPVVEGVSRGLQDLWPDNQHNKVLPVLIHGDAAFAGQGVVTETLNLSQLDGYATQGTVHIVINNQIGYTTLSEHARSTRYSTDVAKMLMVPIFHVHGENPEALVHVMRLAHEYRHTFAKDVVVDLVCYRRHGHNEGDEPYFTQPQMYDRIRERPPVHKLFADQLMTEGIISQTDLDEIIAETNQCLNDQFLAEQETPRVFPQPRFYDVWKDYQNDYQTESVNTGIPEGEVKKLSQKLNQSPEEIKLHPKLQRIFKSRLDAVTAGHRIDWANAETLAFASIVKEGATIRLSGQDSGRGTFSQRHSVVYNRETGSRYVPLNHIDSDQGQFNVYDSSLSETGVLGFEYGYSMVRPDSLVLWEAQFGDFVNNAQSVIDLYIASGESKWQRLSGLVLLLPHGWEGMGPEHSSARLERFLQLCAHDNIQVCYPTTPAQYFHLLRRQIKSKYRKPLVVITPKSLLRNPQAVSSVGDLAEPGFLEVLNEPADQGFVTKVLMTSGKIFYELRQRKQELEADDIAIIRLEQFYPFPKEQLQDRLSHYHNAKKWIWVQEEPENMGGYVFVRNQLDELIEGTLQYIGRKASASPATGFHNIFRQEQTAIIDQAIGHSSFGSVD